MSVVRKVSIVCDVCGSIETTEHHRADLARSDLHVVGWRERGNGDLCPTCNPNRTVRRDYMPGAPEGLCDCGCGELTAVAPRSRASAGWVKGRPMPRVPGHRTPAPIRDKSTGCLIWQGRIEPSSGYPRRGSGWAHIMAYEDAYGPVPPDHQVDHKCTRPPCVEPIHLVAVLASVNRSLVGSGPRV